MNFGIRIKQLYALSLLQFANVVITLYQSVYDAPFSSIWPLMGLIFYEGLLGGFLNLAFVFDIDGVLIRGEKGNSGAGPTLELLNEHKVPFILLTNGGGVSEERVQFISETVQVPISPLQIVQSHTPMKALAHKHAYDRVLVVGGPGDKARHCAIGYGFHDVIMPIDIVRANPAVSPHHRYTVEDFDRYSREVDLKKPIEAILVFNDPRDMTTDIQIVSDLLNSDHGL
ncbi:hypothetical protein G9P44_005451 [Scheffersomyces stipitis]|nr:hypothetical protein G9P44_005451 [Scheffersomyces stipitis]